MIIDLLIEFYKNRLLKFLKAVGFILGIFLLGMIFDKESRDDFITIKFPNIFKNKKYAVCFRSTVARNKFLTIISESTSTNVYLSGALRGP